MVYNRPMKAISGEVLDTYLGIVNKKYGDDLSMEEIKKIFNVAVDDFKKDKLYLELLSHICNYLWAKAHLKTWAKDKQQIPVNKKLDEFTWTLYWIAEVDYYMHNLENEISERRVIDTLKAIRDYKRRSTI